jgi:hypothetical protein
MSKRHNSTEMAPLTRADFAPPSSAAVKRLRAVAERRGLDFERDVAPRLYHHPGELFSNEFYNVIRERLGEWWHLSIKPLTKDRRSRWRDYQRIKNELVGPEHEAVELFPAESRLVDTADQYHLWVATDPAYRFPFGYLNGRVVSDED